MAGVNLVVPDTAVPDSSTTHPDAQVSEPVALAGDLIELARAAAIEEAGDEGVGDYLGAWAEDAVATSARFAAHGRGYRGWYWLVTVAVVEPARPTISEVVLLPGDGALLAPAWVPWDQRVRAGDLGVGDLLPTTAEDDRLVPGYLDSDDPAVREVDYEFGFGRVRVLGQQGRDDAAQRWHDGPFGPSDPMAKQAPGVCISCGFYVRLEGMLGQAFGACSNEFSPADGRVVDAAYGCGAHSETVVDAPLISASTAAVMDEITLEVHRRPEAGTHGPVTPVTDDEPGPLADATSTPTEAEPTEAQPIDGEPTEAESIEAESIEAASVEAEPTEAERTKAEPAPSDPELVAEPAPSDPELSAQPAPFEPEPAAGPASTEPEPGEPAAEAEPVAGS
jgi:hypothetical protein